MATAKVEDENTHTCPICFEQFKIPRKLPVCSHSFCEECIKTCVLDSKSDFENEGKFPCPVCRVTCSFPRKEKRMLKWVKKLELDKDKMDKLEHDSEDTRSELCVPCKELKRVTTAVKYCIECGENLCNNCSAVSHRFAPLKCHTLIDIETGCLKHKKVKQTLSECLICRKHPGQTLTFINSVNGKLHCCRCSREDKIQGLIDTKDYSTKDENEERIENLLDKVAKLTSFSKAIIDRKRSNEADNKKQTENIRGRIREMRTKLNDIFDALEENAVQQCKALTKTYTLSNAEDIQILIGNMDSLNTYKATVEKFEDDVSRDVLVALITNLEIKLRETETDILEMGESSVTQSFEIEVQQLLEDLLEIEINDTDNLLEIKEQTGDFHLPDYTERRLLKNYTVEDVESYSPMGEDFEDYPTYSGIVCLPNNEDLMVLVDNRNGLCCLINCEYEVVAVSDVNSEKIQEDEPGECCLLEDGTEHFPFPRSRFVGVSILHDNTVVASIPDLKKLVFFSIDTDEETINAVGEVITEKQPFAVCGLSNGNCVVTWLEPCSVSILTFSKYCRYDEIIHFDRDNSGRIFKTFRYLAVDEDREHIIQPCIEDKAVYCFDFEGNAKFQYRHKKLVFPQGVTLDTDGNIYAIDSRKQCIHLLSPQGIGVRIIKNCDLYWPMAIAFKHVSNQLVIICDSGPDPRVCVAQLG